MAINETKAVISDLAKVMDKTTLGRSTIYAYVKDGKFPAPIKLGDRAIGWIDAEIDAWIDERIKASRTAA
jgi:prophage regulatory protein